MRLVEAKDDSLRVSEKSSANAAAAESLRLLRSSVATGVAAFVWREEPGPDADAVEAKVERPPVEEVVRFDERDLEGELDLARLRSLGMENASEHTTRRGPD